MDSTRFEQLLDSYLDEAADAAELQQLLQGDAGLRKRFVDRLVLEIHLQKAFALPWGPPVPLPKPRRFGRAWVAAAAVLLFGVALGSWGLLGYGADEAQVSQSSRLPTDAVLIAQEPQASQELLRLINEERAKYQYKSKDGAVRAVPPVREDVALDEVARRHARDMGRNRQRSIREVNLNRELENAGYPQAYWGLVPGAVGANVPEAFRSWMDAKVPQTVKELPHPREVLLNPYLEDVGVAVYQNRLTGARYVCVLLAKKK